MRARIRTMYDRLMSGLSATARFYFWLAVGFGIFLGAFAAWAWSDRAHNQEGPYFLTAWSGLAFYIAAVIFCVAKFASERWSWKRSPG